MFAICSLKFSEFFVYPKNIILIWVLWPPPPPLFNHHQQPQQTQRVHMHNTLLDAHSTQHTEHKYCESHRAQEWFQPRRKNKKIIIIIITIKELCILYRIREIYTSFVYRNAQLSRHIKSIRSDFYYCHILLASKIMESTQSARQPYETKTHKIKKWNKIKAAINITNQVRA